jgi:hypothetical protein
MTQEAEQIVRGWLDDISFSAATWNLDAHMQLVSRQVEVTGIPRIQRIDYDGWRVRRKNEFEKKLLHSLTYRLGKILKEVDDQIHFSVEETMRARSGQTIVADKEVILKREEDGQWRVRHERFGAIRLRQS